MKKRIKLRILKKKIKKESKNIYLLQRDVDKKVISSDVADEIIEQCNKRRNRLISFLSKRRKRRYQTI